VSSFYRSFERNGVGIYQCLATDRFEHHPLDAVACNGADKTYGKQAKFRETDNLPEVFLASLRFKTFPAALESNFITSSPIRRQYFRTLENIGEEENNISHDLVIK
jgi:hypothetical protein